MLECFGKDLEILIAFLGILHMSPVQLRLGTLVLEDICIFIITDLEHFPKLPMDNLLTNVTLNFQHCKNSFHHGLFFFHQVKAVPYLSSLDLLTS